MPQTITTEVPVTPAAGAPAADAVRADALIQSAADITEMCARHGVPQLAASLIRSGATVDKARESVLNELALRDAAQGGHVNVRSIQTGRDETETRLKGLEEALNHRLDSRSAITDNGRQYRSLSLLEIGRDYLQSRGIDTRGMDRMRLATEMLHFRSAGMHTTSDFSNLMGNVANKRLRAAYEQNPGTLTAAEADMIAFSVAPFLDELQQRRAAMAMIETLTRPGTVVAFERRGKE
jgi:hypothetical protein